MWQTNEWPKENSDYLVLCEFIFRSISSWVKFSISRSDLSSKFPLWPHNSKMLNSKQAVGIPIEKVWLNQSKRSTINDVAQFWTLCNPFPPPPFPSSSHFYYYGLSTVVTKLLTPPLPENVSFIDESNPKIKIENNFISKLKNSIVLRLQKGYKCSGIKSD